MHDAHVHEMQCKCGSQTPGVLHSPYGSTLNPLHFAFYPNFFFGKTQINARVFSNIPFKDIVKTFSRELEKS